MPEIRINLNETIRFKPTQRAHEIYYKQMEDISKQFSALTVKPHYISTDKDGYASMQLWKFMEAFGPHIHMGAPIVCEPLEIIYSEPAHILTLEEVKETQLCWIEDADDGMESKLFPAVVYGTGWRANDDKAIIVLAHKSWHADPDNYEWWYDIKDYRKWWRPWSQKPTNKQMEAVK